jgi:hypothetical protein
VAATAEEEISVAIGQGEEAIEGKMRGSLLHFLHRRFLTSGERDRAYRYLLRVTAFVTMQLGD